MAKYPKILMIVPINSENNENARNDTATSQAMEKKSLRAIAKELNVSHSYLSQVLSGKRPASEKIAYRLSKAGLLGVNGRHVVSRSGKQVVSKNGKQSSEQSYVQKAGAEGGGRTHTNFEVQRILSPSRLPIPPPRPECNVITKLSTGFYYTISNHF